MPKINRQQWEDWVKQYFFEDLQPGMAEEVARKVTAEMIDVFAEVSGDNNPLHLDAAYAATTQFKERIAHGALSASFISAVLGTLIPGLGTIYLSQTVRFLAPVMIGDRVVARAEVILCDATKNRVSFKTCCFVGDKKVVDGEAIVYVPNRQEVAD